jgi:hypothetical protein
MTTWLLVVCISLGSRWHECDSRGGVSTVQVTEQQCKAMLTVPGIRAWCVDGNGFVHEGQGK